MPIRSPLFLRSASTAIARRRRCSLVACLLSSVVLFSGCAKNPPASTSSIALSGHVLHVIIPFRGTINPAYSYFFLINYDQSVGSTGNKNGAGPLPILIPFANGQGGVTYGNGIAASSAGTASPGFTDYVQYGGSVGATFQVFHVNPSDPTGRTVINEGAPYNYLLPNNSNPNQLEFYLDLSQIVSASSGGALSATDTITQARAITYLQANIVATNIVPVDLNTTVLKQVDSVGDTTTTNGRTSFLSFNVLDTHVYTSGDPLLSPSTIEPSSNDVFTTDGSTGDESLDMLNYTIAVTQQQ